MENAQHTPGPWKVSKPTGNYIDAPTGSIAALTYGATKADADLIAAAPELLAACETMLAQLGSANDFAAWEAAKDGLATAIAKAKGE